MRTKKLDRSDDRLQKILSRVGLTSRRKAETLIKQGRVTVNGKVAILGTKADPKLDSIMVNGEAIPQEETKVYLRLHKPRGYITALSDDRGRPVVVDLLNDVIERIYPIGRLDYDTEGVLLLTNDGDLAHALLHPSHQIPRTYQAKIKGSPSAEKLAQLSRGIKLDDGVARAVHVERLHTTPAGHVWIELIMTEGKNREVRRMCDAIGHPVQRLKRIRFANIQVEDLRPGEYRELSREQVRSLYRVTGLYGVRGAAKMVQDQ